MPANDEATPSRLVSELAFLLIASGASSKSFFSWPSRLRCNLFTLNRPFLVFHGAMD
jgi:hypothetical protein